MGNINNIPSYGVYPVSLNQAMRDVSNMIDNITVGVKDDVLSEYESLGRDQGQTFVEKIEMQMMNEIEEITERHLIKKEKRMSGLLDREIYISNKYNYEIASAKIKALNKKFKEREKTLEANHYSRVRMVEKQYRRTIENQR